MDNAVMPCCVFGKRKCFPCHTSDTLAQGVVPSFHVRSFAGFFADTLMVVFGKDVGVSLPKITEGTTGTVSSRYPVPEFTAGCLTPVAVDVSDNLPRPPAKRRPRPYLVGAFFHVATHLVKLQHVVSPGFEQALRHLRQQAEFFLATRSR